jgi:hypothetical protein
MSDNHFSAVIEVLKDRLPFQIFTVELKSGPRLEVDHFGALMFLSGMAVFSLPGGIKILFDAESVSHIIDAPASDVPNGTI